MHVDWVNVDQINNVVIGDSGASGDNAFLEKESLHGSSIINEWGQG